MSEATPNSSILKEADYAPSTTHFPHGFDPTKAGMKADGRTLP